VTKGFIHASQTTVVLNTHLAKWQKTKQEFLPLKSNKHRLFQDAQYVCMHTFHIFNYCSKVSGKYMSVVLHLQKREEPIISTDTITLDTNYKHDCFKH